jgi:filamentous hemagglutinin family protein
VRPRRTLAKMILQRHGVLSLLAAATLATGDAFGGDVVFDGSLPGTSAGALLPSAGVFAIEENRGFVNGANLFHSFDRFSIDAGESAVFDSSAGIKHIISRVTGNNMTSFINGEITASNADITSFWLVNPAGVIVGAGGALNVPGAIALGAADFIEFEDGQRWYAQGGGGASAVTLNVKPVDFGFLPVSHAGIVFTQDQNFFYNGTDLIPGNVGVGFSTLLTGGSVGVTSSFDLALERVKIETSPGGFAVIAGGQLDGDTQIFGSIVRSPLVVVTSGKELLVDIAAFGSPLLDGSVRFRAQKVEFSDVTVQSPHGTVGVAAVPDPYGLQVQFVAGPDDFLFAPVPEWPSRAVPENTITTLNTRINTASSEGSGGIYLLGEALDLRATRLEANSSPGSPADVTGLGIHIVGGSLKLQQNSTLASVLRRTGEGERRSDRHRSQRRPDARRLG